MRWAILVIFCGCTGQVDPLPDVCDGSDDVRLYVGFWSPDASSPGTDYVLNGEGTSYLKIDGRCHYYVYRGAQPELRSWAPVHEGDLDPKALDQVLARMHVFYWPLLDDGALDGEALASAWSHAGWKKFHVAGAEYTCTNGCSGTESVVERALVGVNEVVAELDEAGSPVSATRAEVLAKPSRDDDLYYAVPWGAERPIEEFVQDTTDAALGQDVDGLGIYVEPPESTWFLEAADAYRQAMQADPRVEMGAMGILDDQGQTSHVLYVRSVVP